MEGKLKTSDLVKYVFGSSGARRDEVLIRPGIGEDTAAFVFGGGDAVLCTIDPISGTENDIGRLAIRVNSNDIAAAGGEPALMLLCLLMPVGSEAETVGEIMASASAECKRLNIEIIGGHTEFTSAVNRPVLTGVCIGRQRKENLLVSDDIEAGDVLILAGSAGTEGTAIIAHDFFDDIDGILSYDIIEEAKSMMEETSVVEIGRLAAENGAKKMHDCTEGGVYGALWELAEGAGLGLEIYEDKIDVRPATDAVCKFYKISPYKLISSGAMLIVSSDKGASDILTAFSKTSKNAAIIGKFNSSKSKKILLADGNVKNLEEPQSDDLYKVVRKLGQTDL